MGWGRLRAGGPVDPGQGVATGSGRSQLAARGLCLPGAAGSRLQHLGLRCHMSMVVATAAVAQSLGWTRLIVPLVVLVVLGLAEVVLIRAFPGDGTYPFWVADLAEILGFCALGLLLTWRVSRARLPVAMFVVYGATALASFVVPSPVGSNLARLRDASVPVIAFATGLRGWRPRGACLGAVAIAVAWTIPGPATVANLATASAASGIAYWAPAVATSAPTCSPPTGWRRSTPLGTGLPTAWPGRASRWSAAGSARTTSPPLHLVPVRTAHELLVHLVAAEPGVAYVVATNAPPHFSSQGELALLASSRSRLRVAWQGPNVAIYELPGPTPMITGPAPASLLALDRTSMSIEVGAPGRYVVAVHWSRYWHNSSGCVTRKSTFRLRRSPPSATRGLSQRLPPNPTRARTGLPRQPVDEVSRRTTPERRPSRPPPDRPKIARSRCEDT